MVVFRAYGTTIGLTIVGTVLGLLLQTMTAYVLSRKEFEWRNQFSFSSTLPLCFPAVLFRTTY